LLLHHEAWCKCNTYIAIPSSSPLLKWMKAVAIVTSGRWKEGIQIYQELLHMFFPSSFRPLHHPADILQISPEAKKEAQHFLKNLKKDQKKEIKHDKNFPANLVSLLKESDSPIPPSPSTEQIGHFFLNCWRANHKKLTFLLTQFQQRINSDRASALF